MAGPWDKYGSAPQASGPWSKYGQAQTPEQPAQQPAPEGFTRGNILPIAKDNKTGEISLAVPGLVKGAVDAVTQAVTLPGRAMAGEVPMTDAAGNVSPEAIAESTNFATVFSPASPASGSGAAIARQAAQPARPGMEAAQAAERIGVELPRAAASDSATVQQAGKILTNVPIGGTPLRKASERAISQLDDAATRAQGQMGSGNAATAGGAARQGITDFAKNTIGGAVKARYDAVDDLVQPNVLTRLENTAKIATDILSTRGNSRIRGNSRAVEMVRDALNTPDGLNYQGVKGLRTFVGELLDDPQRLSSAGVEKAELKRIYGALTDDLKNAVARSGGEKASAAFETANSFAARAAKEREALDSILGTNLSDERIFDRISAMAGSNARADQVGLRRVRGAVSNETWDEIGSAVISRLGRSPDGQFSPDRFLTGYGRLSQEGKAALFGGKKELASALDDIATVSRRFKQLNQFANPSGTGQTIIGGAYLPGLYMEPMSVISSVAGARVLSSLMAKPTSAKALAAYARAYERQATKPNKVTSQALTNTARAVAAFVGNETGNKGISAVVFPSISNVARVPAEPGNENQNVEEQQ